ncbi:hypothetical protein B9Z55_002964 [Caenorhabditis nigoni]|uniref:BTB domain-containing protein n=2 Tax=Caenorhabditis nigoni TaxID=1611254 RepID=A0A2G5VMT4_9PELO|nr:hypothetical protein B9Z55_002964 [Caenorhabditis nigoni]
MVNREKRYSPSESYFGIPWRIKIQRSGPDFAAFLCCKKTEKSENFQVYFEMKLVSVLGTEEKIKKTSFKILDLKDGNDGYGWDFMNWEDVENKFLVNGSIRMECNVELREIRRKSSRKFDDQEVSDVVLVVEEKKFYVSKLFLSFQSTYFRALFLGNFLESTKSEIRLEDVDSESFQFFLELLHGEPSITDQNIEQILRLADMFDTPTATRRCEEYLMLFPTKIPLKTKTRLAVQYHLEDLKVNFLIFFVKNFQTANPFFQQKCLNEVKTIADIPDILSIPLKELDFRLARSMLRKA